MQIKAAEELGAVGLIIYSDPRDDGLVTVGNGYAPYPAGPARNPVCRRSTIFMHIAASYLKFYLRRLFNEDLSSIYRFIRLTQELPVCPPTKMLLESKGGTHLRSRVCPYLLQMQRGCLKKLAGSKRADFFLAESVEGSSS